MVPGRVIGCLRRQWGQVTVSGDHQALTFGSGRDGVPVPHQKGEGAMAVGASEAENNRLGHQAARVTRLLVTRLLVRTSTCMARGGHLSRCDDTPDQFTSEAARQNSDSSITAGLRQGTTHIAARAALLDSTTWLSPSQPVTTARTVALVRRRCVRCSRQMFDESADPVSADGQSSR